MIHITDHQTDVILDDITEDYFWDDKHKKSLKDNLETLHFTTFADKSFSEYLTKRNRLIIEDEDNKLIEFVITNTRKYHANDSLKCEIRASASYITLKTAKVIKPFTSGADSAQTHTINALVGTGWEVGTVAFKGVRTIKFEEHTNPFAYLKKIASTFDLELHFRVESDGNRITRRYVDLVEKIGGWQGKEVVFGKDLAGIERKENFRNIVTALIGLAPAKPDGTRLEVLVENQEALERWGRNGQHIIATYEPQSEDQNMTEARLTTLTENELEKRINSVVEYKADVIDLENIIGLEHEKIRHGDTVRIKDTKFNPPLYLEARVYDAEGSIKKKTGKKVVQLGDYTEYTEDQVNAQIKALRSSIITKISAEQLKQLTYEKQEIDNKDQSTYQDSTIYSDQMKQQANEYTDNNALVKDKQYTNGLFWSDQDGLIVMRSDGLVRLVQNATDGFKIQNRATISDPWKDQVYLDSSGNAVFSGKVDGAVISGSVFESILNSLNYTNIQDNHIHSEGNYWDEWGGTGDGTSNMFGIFDINDGKFSLKSGQILSNGSRDNWATELLLNHIGMAIRFASGGGTFIGNSGDIGFGDWFDGPNSTGRIYSEGNDLTIDANGKIRILKNVHFEGTMITEDWIRPPLSNGWISYGAPYHALFYRKDATGRVHMRGVIKNGTVGAYTAVFTLPIGYRPSGRLMFEGAKRIDVDPNGTVSVATGSNAFVSFNGVSFFAD